MPQQPGSVPARVLPAIAGLAAIAPGLIAGNAPVRLLSSEVFDVAPGPLVQPPSLEEVRAYLGLCRIDNDGNWYALFQFPILNPNSALEFARDEALFRNAEPYNRAGYAFPASPGFSPASDNTGSVSPYSDTQLAMDGTVAQIVRGVTGFALRPDGTPDTGTTLVAFPGLERMDLAVVNNAVIFAEGDQLAPFDTLYQLLGEGPATVGPISTVEPLTASSAIAEVEFEQGPGTFDPSVDALFRLDNLGTPAQAATLLLSTDDAFTIPGLGLGVSSYNASEEGLDTNQSGSFITTIDIAGAPFDQDDAVLVYDASTDTYSIPARAGEPSPLGSGRTLSLIFNNAVAINQRGDIAYVIDDTGNSSNDTAIIVNDAAVVREGDTVGTFQPGLLQSLRLFAGRNIELDREANVIWPGVWSIDNLCTGQTSNGSDFGIFQAIFFNTTPILESGVTQIHDVHVGDLFFPTLVVKEIINSEFGGFTVSPDGDRLIAAVWAVEPSANPCDFSDNVDRPGVFLIVEVDLEAARNPCPADLAAPFGTLNFFDIAAYIGLYNTGDPQADIAAPFGSLNFFDISAYIGLYNAGCP